MRDAIRSKGLSTINDLFKSDKEDIKIMCSSVCKPGGGTIPDPADPTLIIPNPGYNILAIAEKRLRLSVYAGQQSIE